MQPNYTPAPMILQCDECNARYLLPDAALGAAGRTVRCARCKHSWFASPPATGPAPLPDLDIALEAINQKPRPIPPGSNVPARRAEPASGALKFAVAAAWLAAAALAGFCFKPQWLGMPRSEGMQLDELKLVTIKADSPPTYQLSGKIVNKTAAPHTVPNLRVTLVDDKGAAVQRPWDYSGGGASLESGKDTPFTTDNLEIYGSGATKLVVELGSKLELALRRKPE